MKQERLAVPRINDSIWTESAEEQAQRLLKLPLIAAREVDRPLPTAHQRIPTEEQVLNADANAAWRVPRGRDKAQLGTVPRQSAVEILPTHCIRCTRDIAVDHVT